MGLSLHSTQIMQGMSNAEPCQHKHEDLLFVNRLPKTELGEEEWVEVGLLSETSL